MEMNGDTPGPTHEMKVTSTLAFRPPLVKVGLSTAK